MHNLPDVTLGHNNESVYRRRKHLWYDNRVRVRVKVRTRVRVRVQIKVRVRGKQVI